MNPAVRGLALACIAAAVRLAIAAPLAGAQEDARISVVEREILNYIRRSRKISIIWRWNSR
jgi:hypothetical protein